MRRGRAEGRAWRLAMSSMIRMLFVSMVMAGLMLATSAMEPAADTHHEQQEKSPSPDVSPSTDTTEPHIFCEGRIGDKAADSDLAQINKSPKHCRWFTAPHNHRQLAKCGFPGSHTKQIKTSLGKRHVEVITLPKGTLLYQSTTDKPGLFSKADGFFHINKDHQNLWSRYPYLNTYKLTRDFTLLFVHNIYVDFPKCENGSDLIADKNAVKIMKAANDAGIKASALILFSLVGLAMDVVGLALFRNFRKFQPENFVNYRFVVGSKTEFYSKGARQANLNGVFLHVLADTLNNLGFIFAAWMRQQSSIERAHAIISLCVALLTLRMVTPLFQSTLAILLQSAPVHTLDAIDKSIRDIRSYDGVLECRSEHYWSQAPDVVVGTLHVRIRSDANHQDILCYIHGVLRKYITDLTIQIEKDPPVNWMMSPSVTSSVNFTAPGASHGHSHSHGGSHGHSHGGTHTHAH